MFSTRIPFLAGVTAVVLLALVGGLATAAPGAAPEEPTKGAAASVAGADDTFADPLTESGRWEWAGGGALNDIFFVDSAYGWAVGPGVWRTTDGGSTAPCSALGGTSLERVVFADRLRGWVQAANGRVFRTRTAARPGHMQRIPAWGCTRLRGPACTGSGGGGQRLGGRAGRYCYYDGCDSGGLVHHSTDGGISWSATELPSCRLRRAVASTWISSTHPWDGQPGFLKGAMGFCRGDY